MAENLNDEDMAFLNFEEPSKENTGTLPTPISLDSLQTNRVYVPVDRQDMLLRYSSYDGMYMYVKSLILPGIYEINFQVAFHDESTFLPANQELVEWLEMCEKLGKHVTLEWFRENKDLGWLNQGSNKANLNILQQAHSFGTAEYRRESAQEKLFTLEELVEAAKFGGNFLLKNGRPVNQKDLLALQWVELTLLKAEMEPDPESEYWNNLPQEGDETVEQHISSWVTGPTNKDDQDGLEMFTEDFPEPKPTGSNAFKGFCPVCRSVDVSDSSIYQNNGILGPGRANFKVTDTRTCNECGVMFKPTALNRA